MTHEVKNIILAEIPPQCLEDLGCRNPDVWAKSRTDSTIILTPPRNMPPGKARKSRVVTKIKASKIEGIGDLWRDKVPVLHLVSSVGAAMEEVLNAAEKYPDLLRELERLIEEQAIRQVTFSDDMPWIMVEFKQKYKQLECLEK